MIRTFLFLLLLQVLSVTAMAQEFHLMDEGQTKFDISIDAATGQVKALIITPAAGGPIQLTQSSQVLRTEQEYRNEGYQKVAAVPYSILVKNCPVAPKECLINPEQRTYFIYRSKAGVFGRIKKEMESYFFLYNM